MNTDVPSALTLRGEISTVSPKSPGCCCTARVTLLLLVLAIGAGARDMYVLMGDAPMPALMCEGRMWLALADSARRNHHYEAGGYHLFIHDFTTYRDSLVRDSGLIDTINCLAQNDRSVFAGGRGLSVFDKAEQRWRQWDSLARFRIWDVEATDSVLWLATDRHGVVRCNLADSSLRRITTTQGLASNSVFSLCLVGDTLFAGPFRYGMGGDWFGRDLDGINVRTRGVRHVSLPTVPDPYHVSKQWVVTDIYPSLDRPGRLRCVLWYPWDVWCWDRGEPGALLMDAGQARAVADGVLSRCGCDTDTEMRTRVIKYLIRRELVPETQQLIAELAEGSSDPRRFPRYAYQPVAVADYKRMRRFYTSTLGFVLYREKGTSACCLVLDDQLLLYLEGTDDRTRQIWSRTRPYLLLPARTVLELYQRLKAAGIACTPDTLSWRLEFEFKDPTGNRIKAVGFPERSR